MKQINIKYIQSVCTPVLIFLGLSIHLQQKLCTHETHFPLSTPMVIPIFCLYEFAYSTNSCLRTFLLKSFTHLCLFVCLFIILLSFRSPFCIPQSGLFSGKWFSPILIEFFFFFNFIFSFFLWTNIFNFDEVQFVCVTFKFRSNPQSKASICIFVNFKLRTYTLDFNTFWISLQNINLLPSAYNECGSFHAPIILVLLSNNS